MSNHSSTRPSSFSPNHNPSATTLTLVDPTVAGPAADEPFKLDRRTYLRKAAIRIGILVVIDAALPTILYYILKNILLPVWALVASSAPAVLMVLIQAIIRRKLDVVGVLVIIGFALSAILATLSSDAKLLLLRESVITCSAGILALLTLIPFRFRTFRLRPVLFYLARDLIPLSPIPGSSEPRIEHYWNHRVFRRDLLWLTVAMVVMAECEFAARLTYILLLTLDQIVLFGNITLAIIGSLALVILGVRAVVIGKKVEAEIKKENELTQINETLV